MTSAPPSRVGDTMTLARLDRRTGIGFALVVISAVLYWLADRNFDASRGDFFYLADAFLHGRTWLQFMPGPYDVIVVGDHFYVPFAPFPALLLMPLVAIIGPVTADQWETGINAVLAASTVGLCWWLLTRLRVPRLLDQVWLVILFGFSTQILWVTTRGGVWHTGHLVATVLSLAALIELQGRRRPWLVGLLAGAAFLTRAPLAFAIPFYALMLDPAAAGGRPTFRLTRWVELGLGVAPAVLAFFVYNALRFGSPLESGYALATLPPFLEALRQQGLFSTAHVGMNLDYLFVHLPSPIPTFPFFRPDGLGMSIFLTSPGLFFAIRADPRKPRTLIMAATVIAVLIPTLLYYGGGWFQYGYRYFLDSVPFVMALCGFAAAERGRVGNGWRVLIAFGTIVMAFGVYWAYNL